MLMILKKLKVFRIFFGLFFCLISCENKPVEVVQEPKVLISKQCSAGSFTIVEKPILATSIDEASPHLNQDRDLEIGDEFPLRGTVHNASPCCTGSLSFSCDAIYTHPNERVFNCKNGTFSCSRSAGASSSNEMVSAQFHTFGNGKKFSGHIVLPSLSAQFSHLTCRVGFVCEE